MTALPQPFVDYINLHCDVDEIEGCLVCKHCGHKVVVDYFEKENLPYEVDQMNNVYVTKQTSEDIEIFPCVVAHTDTVHHLDSINIREEMLPNAQQEIKLALKAYNNEGNPTGIGGDDKCGVFACLVLLKELPNLLIVFQMFFRL